MKKIKRCIALMALMLISVNIIAQKTVTGKVSSTKDNGALFKASVTNLTTNKTTVTDNGGNYSILAKVGDVLNISNIGYKSKSVTVGNVDIYNVTLEPGTQEEETVVVTALNIKRNPKELGYAVQSVSGQDIQESQRENFINGLDGRVAGLTINSTSGMAGASSNIVLRGFNSMALDNQPLFVVDGVIMDNSTVNETSNSGTGLGLVETSARNVNQTSNRSSDYTNRIADINPSDIESVTVLKGPEATALYGSQASSGAIIITTRRGRNDGKVAFSYDNSFRITELTRFPQISDKWKAGTNGAPSSVFAYFGPAQDPNVQLYDNLQNFFQTGFAQTHNLSVETGNKVHTVRATGTIFNQSGIVPNNSFNRMSLRINHSAKINKYITISPSIFFSGSNNEKPKRGAGGYMLNLLQWPRTNDARNYLGAEDRKLTLFSSSPNGELDNPYFNVEFNKGYDKTVRTTANANVTIKPNDWFTLTGIFGVDKYKSEGWSFYHPLSNILSSGTGGSLDNYYIDYNGYNHTITASASKKIKKFGVRAMVGTMWQDYKRSMYSVYGTNIIDSVKTNGLMSKNNQIVTQEQLNAWVGDSSATRQSSRLRLSRALRFGDANYVQNRQLAFFGEVSFNYNQMIFLTYSHRFENSSIFPKEFRTYNYPAASVSMIMSDMMPFLKGNVLSYWKLRTSLASTARSSSPYANQSVFTNSVASGTGFYYGFTNNNFFLEPEIQKTYELGTEIRLFKNKFGIDATYYNTLNEKQIAENFRASYATGYVLNTINVGSTRNQGVEISLDATPITRKNFSWRTQVNFNHMWNEVLELPANVPEFYISDSWIYGNARGGLVKGGPTTSITAFGYLRNNKGDIIINPTTGLPVIDQSFKVRGDRNPDFTIGWSNKFTFKRFSVNMLWDGKRGGDIFNATDMFLTINGLSKRTDDRYTPRVIKGVLNDGLQNSANPTANNIVIIPAYNQNYYAATAIPEEEYIEKNVHWVRLRELTLKYLFPANANKRWSRVKSMSTFITGNDLFLFSNYTGADPAVNGNTAGTRGVGAWGFDYGNTPSPISINFGFKIGF